MIKTPFRALKDRRLLAFLSNEQLLETELEQNDRTVYMGFDPTASSIHLGNLCGLLALQHFRLKGYHSIVLFGGATGMIGDPSGRS